MQGEVAWSYGAEPSERRGRVRVAVMGLRLNDRSPAKKLRTPSRAHSPQSQPPGAWNANILTLSSACISSAPSFLPDIHHQQETFIMAQNDPTRRFFTDLELADDISVFMEQGFDPEVAHFVLLCSAGYLEELTKVQYGMILNSEQEQVLVRAMADVANRGKRVQLWVSTTSLEIDVLEAGKKGKASVSSSVDAV